MQTTNNSYFCYFSKKNRTLNLMQICMKCQVLFSWKNNKTFHNLICKYINLAYQELKAANSFNSFSLTGLNRYQCKQCRPWWRLALFAWVSTFFVILFFWLTLLFSTVGYSKFKDGRIHFINSGVKEFHAIVWPFRSSRTYISQH